MGTPGGNGAASPGPTPRRSRWRLAARLLPAVAGTALSVALGLPSGATSPTDPAPVRPAAVDGPAGEQGEGPVAVPVSPAVDVAAVAVPTAAGQPVLAAGDDEGGEDPPGSVVPLAQVTAGVGRSLGVTLGSHCLGLEIGAQVLGCNPALQQQPVTLDLESRLLPR